VMLLLHKLILCFSYCLTRKLLCGANVDICCLQIRVFADDVVESSEVTTGVTKIGDYELHDLVLLE
jgi:hypothetical protein